MTVLYAQKMKVSVAITSATTAVCARCTVRIPHASVLQNARTTSNRSVFPKILDSLRRLSNIFGLSAYIS